MLVATATPPAFPLGFQGKTSPVPPRIISEIRKEAPVAPKEQFRPRISGELLVMCGTERQWRPRRVLVRGGQLLVSGGANGDASLRLPLRHLNLTAGCLPNSLSLYKGPNIILTLQATTQRTFDLWVKTIAIELIRQTPLEAVKYLDILTLTAPKKQHDFTPKDFNCNYVIKTPAPVLPQPANPLPPPENYQQTVEILLKRCQNSDNYVPVKDKLMLFESLCRLGRKLRGAESDVSIKTVPEEKRATSMYDLSNCAVSPVPGVREICKYFESKKGDEVTSEYGTMARTRKRLINSDTELHSAGNGRVKNL